MAGYVISNITVKDPGIYEDYKKMAASTVATFGGEYIVRGGEAVQVEGDWQPHRMVVLRFESVQAARKWYDSYEYAPARALRHRASDTQMIIVEGS
jgi:uncharacterized protein (DUF1330 family)